MQEDETGAERHVEHPVVAEVTRMRVDYSSGGDEGSAEWTDASLPQAVRVSMTLEEPGLYGEHLQITRKAVFAIHVR